MIAVLSKGPPRLCAIAVLSKGPPGLLSGLPAQAVWFTEEAGPEGSVFGNTDMWKGLAVILDSFDNDGLVRSRTDGILWCNPLPLSLLLSLPPSLPPSLLPSFPPSLPLSLSPSLLPSLPPSLSVKHDNPKIQVVLNDGTMKYEHARYM